MGFQIRKDDIQTVFQSWLENYRIFAPKVYAQTGRFSDTDCVRYGEVTSFDEIVFDKKSEFSYKEVIVPVSQTLFYFTEDQVTEPKLPNKKAMIFLRSCDMHALKRLDHMYLKNGCEDTYYKRLRENCVFVLIGCTQSYDNCFCVSMETNISTNYDMSIDIKDDYLMIDCKHEALSKSLEAVQYKLCEVTPSYVTENKVKVSIPENLSNKVAKSSVWDEYNSRCIACGRCNFVCPTCTCFTMQDLFYTDNGKVGERRRIWASCMVDGYTDVAGGGAYRKKNGERMRFKVLHKVLNYRKRTGYNMCVGCGRCDDICPEYISFSNCINKLKDAMKEVNSHE